MMTQDVTGSFDVGLERSCAAGTGDWVRHGPADDGLERHEAFFSGVAYEPHRHDSYALGFTEAGVQSFGYRGTEEHSLPGHVMVLHPDEIHDGHAGTDQGFRFRMLYIRPDLIQDALGASPLPFVRRATARDGDLAAAILPALLNMDRPLEPLERDRVVVRAADALQRLSGDAGKPLGPVHLRAVRMARDYLAENCAVTVTSERLEAETGMDRYELSRHFRRTTGTSPYRFLVMRRLDRVRAAMLDGASLADASAEAGFADQAHMTRHFKKAYGIAPGKWQTLCRTADTTDT